VDGDYCPRHRPKGQPKEKKVYHIPKVSPKTQARQEQHKLENAEMDLFWMQAEREIDKNPYCMECGEFIDKEYYRAATAHIFPKGIFDSIKAHPMNKLFLGAGCGCHDRTHRLDTFSKMKVWKIAVHRFQIFRPMITEKHKYLTEFEKYANI